MQVGSLPPYKRDGRGLILGSQWILVFLVGFSSAMFDFFSSSTLLWLGLGILEEEELSMLVVHLSDFEAQPRHSGKRVYHSKTFISPSRSPLLLLRNRGQCIAGITNDLMLNFIYKVHNIFFLCSLRWSC